jgi:hypothetical protein
VTRRTSCPEQRVRSSRGTECRDTVGLKTNSRGNRASSGIGLESEHGQPPRGRTVTPEVADSLSPASPTHSSRNHGLPSHKRANSQDAARRARRLSRTSTGDLSRALAVVRGAECATRAPVSRRVPRTLVDSHESANSGSARLKSSLRGGLGFDISRRAPDRASDGRRRGADGAPGGRARPKRRLRRQLLVPGRAARHSADPHPDVGSPHHRRPRLRDRALRRRRARSTAESQHAALPGPTG